MAYNQHNKYRRRSAASWRKQAFVILAVVVITASALTALALTKTFPFSKKESQQPTHSTANSDSKGESQNPNGTPQSQSGTGSSDNKDPDNPSTPSDSPSLQKPEGNLVSAHQVSLSSNPTLASSCQTTPGATCQIIFTKEGVTKSLPQKTTDAGGGAYWTWKPKDVGLTEGSWSVQAKVTLGSQTDTFEDAQPLEVSS
jgi:hypothetical protein